MSRDSPPLVAHVIHRLNHGGLENGLVNLINHMPAARVRHAVICVAGYNEFRSRILSTDVAVYSLEKRAGKDPAFYGRFWRLLRRLRPDIVHTRNFGTVDLQWIALAAGVPYRIHGEHGWEADNLHGLNRRSLLIRRACRPPIQRYVAVSLDIARWLRTAVGIPERRITHICNGVDDRLFHPAGPLPGDLPWRSAPAGHNLVFGTVGRFSPVKNHLALLQAFGSLPAQVSGGPPRLIVVGDGMLAAELHAAARDLGIAGRVWFTGTRNDIPDLLRAIDVFVLPSLNEGVSNTVLEAMATGRPVIAARVGGNPELLESGHNGLLYDPADPRGLTQAMSQYLRSDELRSAHGAAAREQVRRCFGLERMIQRYTDLYAAAVAA